MNLNHYDRFVCDYCNRPFSRKYNLENHIKNCHQNTTRQCPICKQTLGSLSGLQLHCSRGHNRYKKPYPECDHCGRVFTRKQNIVSHMLTVHLQGLGPKIRCKLCRKTFSTERNLKRHINRLHNPDTQYLTCNYCNKLFQCRYSLTRHIQSVHVKEIITFRDDRKGIFKCNLCPKVYSSNKNLQRHFRALHIPNDFKSLDSSEKKCVKNLNSHLRASTEENIQKSTCLEKSFDDNLPKMKFSCRACNKSFDEEVCLRKHIKLEHSFQMFYDYCKKSLIEGIGVVSEIDNKIENSSYECEYSNETLESEHELKEHVKSRNSKENIQVTCYVCFSKFNNREMIQEHKKNCLPPHNVNTCIYCDKLFTDISSLHFHTRIFHPQMQIGDTNVTSTNTEYVSQNSYKCKHCNRVYFSERSMKHHIKLKHTTYEAVECQSCGKICTNKYYLATHIKFVHNNLTVFKCDYCCKEFKSKRNIRRHIEYTHLGIQRYKCVECETLFKEKRSLRKHVRTKHPHSTAFPQCHLCSKRFECAKACKIHLKLIHSFSMNTHPCSYCSVSFSSEDILKIHIKTKHISEDELYKCEKCNVVMNGHENFLHHNELHHFNKLSDIKRKILPHCVICTKDFSTTKTLKRHIGKFHTDFNAKELAQFGSNNRMFVVECNDCIKKLNDDCYFDIYQKLKHSNDSVIFSCGTCLSSFNAMEYAIQRSRVVNLETKAKSQTILSELCTTEMSDEDSIVVFTENDYQIEVKTEPVSP